MPFEQMERTHCLPLEDDNESSPATPSNTVANFLHTTSDNMLSLPTGPIQHSLTSIFLPELPSSPIRNKSTWPCASLDDFSQPTRSRFGESSSTMLDKL